MFLSVIAALLAPVVYFALRRTISPGHFRGVVVAVVANAHFIAWTPIAPPQVSTATLVGTMMLLVLTAFAPHDGTVQRGPVLPLTIALFGTGVVSTYFTSGSGTAYMLQIGVFCTLLVLVARRFSAADLRAFLDGLLAAALLQGLFGVVEFFTHQPVFWGYKVYENGRALYNGNPFLGDSVARIQGTLAHWIPYSAVLSAGLFVLVAQWRRYRPTLRMVAIPLIGVCLFLAGSRTSILVVAAGLLLLTLTSRSAGRAVRNTVIAGGVAIAGVLGIGALTRAADEIAATGSVENRLGNVAAVPGLLGRPPLETLFGSGLDSIGRLFDQDLLLNNGFNVVDNQFVTSIATQGILGVVLLIALLVVGWRGGDRATRPLILLVVLLAFSFDWIRYTSVLVILFPVIAAGGQTEDADPIPLGADAVNRGVEVPTPIRSR